MIINKIMSAGEAKKKTCDCIRHFSLVQKYKRAVKHYYKI